MKRQNISIEKAAKQLVKHIADQEVYGWPPLCPALCYQPVRPKKEETVQSNDERYVEKK